MSTKSDVNLVDTKTPTNQGGDWLQIHNTHTDAKVATNPHTHMPKVNNQNTNRVIKATTGAHLDKADKGLRTGVLRHRTNRRDKGG